MCPLPWYFTEKLSSVAKAKILVSPSSSINVQQNISSLTEHSREKGTLHPVRAQFDAKSKAVERMRSKIATVNEKSGVQLGELSSDFRSVMEDMTATVHDKYPEGSFRRLFWDEQVKALEKSDARQIRWYPALIRWCLHLKFISSGAYHAIRNSGLLTLPSEWTLRDYTRWIRAGTGFDSAVDEQLLKEIDVTEERHKYLMLCWDEMKVKEGLVFNKHTCELVGFTDIGDINNDLTVLNPKMLPHMHYFLWFEGYLRRWIFCTFTSLPVVRVLIRWCGKLWNNCKFVD